LDAAHQHARALHAPLDRSGGQVKVHDIFGRHAFVGRHLALWQLRVTQALAAAVAQGKVGRPARADRRDEVFAESGLERGGVGRWAGPSGQPKQSIPRELRPAFPRRRRCRVGRHKGQHDPTHTDHILRRDALRQWVAVVPGHQLSDGVVG
jgi:hypothetical protein